METFERDLRLRAPLADVWAFHSTIDGLRALTPDWMHLRVDEIERPGDEREDTHVLTEGTRIHMSVQPFGVGPRQRWVSRIEERVENGGMAYFVDVMEDGPFPEWRHTHLFYGDGDETLLRDRVEYRAPLGRSLDGPAKLFFEPMFRQRHRRTREILEDA
ncbi:SRPBCC family protein [Halobacterium litoreum]|uniref:SRPBCC family protein n=1 Tax=Halobacterium litoreum TaxID=2039234 RepID=A0ABD5NC11_9EURY|nr:SRPBCC family protein [Halobacterium litoreum]UHH14312.1 cyclase [Halobacterium litoreum]